MNTYQTYTVAPSSPSFLRGWSVMVLLISLLVASCSDFLDAPPSKGENEVLGNADQVEALFNNSENFNSKVSMVAYSSDDIGYTMELAMKIDPSAYWGDDILHALSFDIEHVEANQWGDEIWEKEWGKVFNANLILSELDNIEGLDATRRATFEAQAHFIRALAYWNLVQTYCQPYAEENFNEPGLPLKSSTSYEESMQRASIKDTYAFIEEDLKAALQVPATDIERRWWVSKPAAQAMLARLYLFEANYPQAAAYAAEALKSQQAELDDYNLLQSVTHDVINPEDNSEDVAVYSALYDYSANKLTTYKENFFSSYFEVKSGLYLAPSDELLALYDDDDLRLAFFVAKDLWNVNAYGYGDDILYHKFYSQMSLDYIQSGPTVPEMLLTAAEALARQGKQEQAMPLVNQLRRARMLNSSARVELSATSQQEAVEKILEERRREMPFVMRWFDIRRLAYNEVTYDDVTVARTFYAVTDDGADTNTAFTYTLPVKSKRYAQPIPTIELSRSQDAMQQNNYNAATDVQTEEAEPYVDENAALDGIINGYFDENDNWIFTKDGIDFKVDTTEKKLYYFDDYDLFDWVEMDPDIYKEFYDDGNFLDYLM